MVVTEQYLLTQPEQIMEQKDIDALATSAQMALKGGKPVDPTAVLALIATYKGIVTSEQFWGVRGPQMLAEVSALRAVEPAARAMLAHGRTLAQVHDGAAAAIASLDALRSGNPVPAAQ